MFVERDAMDVINNDTCNKSLGGKDAERLYSIQFSCYLKLTIEQCRHLGDRLPEGSVICMSSIDQAPVSVFHTLLSLRLHLTSLSNLMPA
jgi:H2-forming N5,N10-methylenetetrahydromethanopterin dehydrogenase-like enzyme